MHPTQVELLPVGQEPTDKAGIYMLTSADQRYGMALAAIDMGSVTLLGERYISPTEKAIVFQRAERRANPAIGIGREFFLTALRDYADWRLKWWREAIQNAVDAGAKTITCSETLRDDDTIEISCEDDGVGMTREVLLDKFLVLGGTTKTGTDTTGGFGKAKELLLLPWLSWRVQTQSIEASGAGISYDVADVPHRKGTKLTVVMPKAQATGVVHAEIFLGRSNLPGRTFHIVRDGQRKTIRAQKRVTRELRDLDNMTIGFVKEAKDYESSSIAVRSNGLFMFDIYIDTMQGGSIVVDLKGSTVSTLTANRDGFREYEVKRELQAFVNEFAKDTKSALRSKALIREKFSGTHKFSADIKATREREAQERARTALVLIGNGNAPNALLEYVGLLAADAEHTHAGDPVGQATSTSLATAEVLWQSLKPTPANLETICKQMVWTPAYYLYSDVEGFRIPKEFRPETMSPRIAKLLSVWTELCRYALMALDCGDPFGVGFVFSHDSLAQYSVDDGERWLLLNPFRSRKTMSLLMRPSDRSDLATMFSCAVHEVTHMADHINYHDEAFAAALTANMAKCGDGFQHARAIARTIKLGDVAR